MTQRKAAREDQLLQVAIRLLQDKGLPQHLHHAGLADAIGMRKASLYYYIDSKEELVRRLLERAIPLLGAQVDEIYAADLPPLKSSAVLALRGLAARPAQ